jgi:hypothetical protein
MEKIIRVNYLPYSKELGSEGNSTKKNESRY